MDLDEQLRDAGAHWRTEQSDPVVDVVGATARRRSRRALVAACVSVIVVGSAVAVLATRTDTGPRVSVAPPTSATPTSAPPRPDVIPLNAEIVQPDVLAVDGTRLWVTGYAPDTGRVNDIRGTEGPAHLQEIDSETGALVGDITLPDNVPGSLRIGDGVVWLSGQQGEQSTEYLEVDTTTMRVVARIPGLKTGELTVTPDAVWATDGIGGLRRIDPTTARVITTIDLHSNPIYVPLGVVAGAAGVFVGNGYNGTIQRIDPTTNTAGPEIHVADDLADMVELNDSLWVGRSDGSQVIEVRNGAVARTIDLPERGYSLASDGTDLWLGTATSHVMRVDPRSGSVSLVELPAGTRALTVAADPSTGAVWATSTTPTPRLLRVPTATAPVTTTTVDGCQSRDCPPPRPGPCAPNQTEPSMATGSYCGPDPVPGNGLGPSGECTGRELAPPCGPGMVADRYYAYTLPGRCDGKLILDGGQWLSTLPPPTNSPDMYVWVRIGAQKKGAGFISPAGAVGFEPDTGPPATGRSDSCR